MRRHIKQILTIYLLLAIFGSISYGADSAEKSQWKSFDAAAGDEFTFSFPHLTVLIKQQDQSSSIPSSIREDNLIMIVGRRDGTLIKQKFKSTYGHGRILFKGSYLFLEYGVGRGSGVRDERIKAYAPFADCMDADTLVEVFDIQKSYRVPSPHATGDVIEYKVKINEEKKNIRVILYSAKKGYGIPQSKEILLKK